MHNAPVVGHAPLVVSLSGRPASPAPPPPPDFCPFDLTLSFFPRLLFPPPPFFSLVLTPSSFFHPSYANGAPRPPPRSPRNGFPS